VSDFGELPQAVNEPPSNWQVIVALTSAENATDAELLFSSEDGWLEMAGADGAEVSTVQVELAVLALPAASVTFT
jgi:hypothetical protein